MSRGRGMMIVCIIMLVTASCIASARWTPLSVEENNNLAWSLATNPDPAKRNGKKAVLLAEDACRRTQYHETIMVGTLAAAYAETGRYDDAIAMAQKACALAAESNDTNLLERNEQFLEIYQSHQPYHETR